MTSQFIIFVITAYLLGSIPFGKLIARQVAQINITRRGSGNIGATNVARELGVIWGMATLLLDVLKGFVPVLAFAIFTSQTGIIREIGLIAVGLSALSGHQFSLFLKFRGGKGVATAVGIYLVISPVACLVAALFFFLIVYKWDFVSLGSIISAIAMPILLAAFGHSPPIVIGSFIAAALICFKHADNIQRLAKGEERKWRGKKNQPRISRSLSNSSSE